MSKTDKTRPYWVIEAQDGYVDHDHRNGQCKEETFEHLRLNAGGRMTWRHSMTCPRYTWGIRVCEGYSLEYCPLRRTSGTCTGHRRRLLTQPDIECSACSEWDDFKEVTCYRQVDHHKVNWHWGRGGIPRDFLHAITHSPNRRISRDTLKRAAGEYNAGYDPEEVDVDDAWEPELRPDKGAGYYWW